MVSSSSSAHTNINTHDEPTSDAASNSDSPLEIDNADNDSAYEEGHSSYTMSATSSVFNFRYENGRRYHGYSEGQYLVPNDDVEMDRLDLQHHAFRLTLDGQLYRAPIPKDVQRVLDLGCGTGIWTIEFADEHPSAHVIGTDLSPIQPEQVPPNCEFLIDDSTKDWIFHDRFDFIHTRAMVAAIKDWGRLFEQAYANLKPGGYIECQELTFPIKCIDPSITAENSPLMRWSDLFFEAAERTGLDATGPRHLAPKLQQAGFVDINLKTHKWPLGNWAKGAKFKLLGRYVYEDLWDALPSLSLGLFTRVLQWSREEVEVFLAECRQESKRTDRHYYADCLFWYAQKPEDASKIPSRRDLVYDEEVLELDEEGEADVVAQSTSPPDAEASSTHDTT